MLENLFGSKTRVKLLNLFFDNSESCFYIRGISREIKENLNSVRREVINLEELEIIKSVPLDSLDLPEIERTKEAREKRKYYQVNKDQLLYNELLNLITRAKILADKELLEKIKLEKGIKLLVLSGIFVGNQRARTDILIMGSVDKNKIKRLIGGLERDLEHPLRYSIMSQSEFNYRNVMTDKFLFEIMESKKIVVLDKRR
ncbi:MAG: putative transcriptional regulator [Candidatus Kuenenbacteria bacterium GW2011_GWA2_42_15]|nr:MAG: putative transcriptional regulator [Candidatus Kuenenbacteria bacterium GW2011_GWA2_42_15]OGG96152.1 MAG: hypothetical protein A2V95_02265 [Candidatus Kuenenbacteria bacterium RBG_16_41_7]